MPRQRATTRGLNKLRPRDRGGYNGCLAPGLKRDDDAASSSLRSASTIPPIQRRAALA